MPSASLLTTPPDAFWAEADQLLQSMASIRRSERVLARRPMELETLTGSQTDLVRFVLRNPGVSVAEAAKELRLAPNTVSTLVRQLVDQGMLVRRIDPLDRRVARLDLTPAMQHKVGAFRDRRLVTLVGAIQRLSTGDQRRLSSSVSILERLAELLRQEESLNE
jgi:DNA-binding MarR family transcriptional regulator